MCLAAADDATRRRCVRIIEAASAGGASSSLPDIASSAALTRGLLDMKNFAAVKAVFAALGVAIDHPSLKAVGYAVPSLVAAYGFDAVEAAGVDVSFLKAFKGREKDLGSCILVSFLLCSYTRALKLTPPPPPRAPSTSPLSVTAPTYT